MNSPCHIPGCHKLSGRHSPLCSTHRAAQARNGHPLQSSVKVHELKPVLALLKARRAANPKSPAWAALAERWIVVVKEAEAVQAAVSTGAAYNRHMRQAAGYVTAVAKQASPADVVDQALAVFMLAQSLPHRFRSDEAQTFQAVRRVRSLTDVHVGTYWNSKANKVTRVYKVAPPGAVRVMGQWLREAFAFPAVKLWELEERDAMDKEARKRAELERMAAAIEEME